MSADNLVNALVASVYALRSYQHHNDSADLAKAIADAGEGALHAAGCGGALLAHGSAEAVIRQHGLSVDIVHGRVVIAIGIDALMTAVDGGPHSPEDLGYRIDDRDGFAGEILSALLDEEEDGTTLVHTMLDTATEMALDAGSICVTYIEDIDDEDALPDDGDGQQ